MKWELRWPASEPEQQKRGQGRYYTAGDPFGHPAFQSWAIEANIANEVILEPFAGSNGLIRHLERRGICKKFASYDIEPGGDDVRRRDTLADFPNGFGVCVTNPPWLAKNSARVRGIEFPRTKHDDLYKFALEKCLGYCDWVAALVPESFIRTRGFKRRLIAFVSLTSTMFSDTGHPVGLALFGNSPVNDPDVWSGMEYVGKLSEIERYRPMPKTFGTDVKFNRQDGNVGLFALDNCECASIRFCDVAELSGYQVKPTGRHITKLLVNGPIRIDDWNQMLSQFREQTWDVLLTSYKGIRKDGRYRRRCDWALARGIIHNCE